MRLKIEFFCISFDAFLGVKDPWFLVSLVLPLRTNLPVQSGGSRPGSRRSFRPGRRREGDGTLAGQLANKLHS